jgi:hypothetical protein
MNQKRFGFAFTDCLHASFGKHSAGRLAKAIRSYHDCGEELQMPENPAQPIDIPIEV